MSHRFDGKVALVSGATSGIGAEVAHRLLAAGATVVFCGLESAEAERLCAIAPQRTRYVAVDLRDPAACDTFVDVAIAAFGRIDIIINNAASVARSTIDSTDAEFFDAMMALNVRAPLLIIRRAMPQLRQQEHGAVVINVGSLNAYVGAPNLLAYATSKGALMTMTRNLARAHRHENIRFHVLNVGWTHSSGEDRLQKSLGNGDDWATKAGASRPTGRLLTTSEVAAAMLFYASDEAAALSGGVVDVEQMPI